jgi:hypothetical protein
VRSNLLNERKKLILGTKTHLGTSSENLVLFSEEMIGESSFGKLMSENWRERNETDWGDQRKGLSKGEGKRTGEGGGT